MKNLSKINLLFLFSIIALVFSCDKDDPEPVNEEELITSVRITFTSTGPIDETFTATWEDLDGEGGNDATVSDLTLTSGNSYDLDVEFFNQNINITAEIKTEAAEHQLFFESSAGLTLLVEYNDVETDYVLTGGDFPVGLSNTASVGLSSTGTLTVILVHEPSKFQVNVAEGDRTNAGGEEDVRVSFPITIQ